MNPVSDTAAQAAIGAAARELRLPTVRAQAARLAEIAVRDHATHLGYLAEVLAAELDDRSARRRARRIADARFPRLKRLADFSTDAVPAITPALLAHLATGTYLDKGEPVVLLGDSGTGKTHLLIGLGLAACEQGRRVRYVTTAALVNELVEAADDRVLSRVVGRYGRLDLLCLDELGYVQIDPKGAELLFRSSPNARNEPRSRSGPACHSANGAPSSLTPAWSLRSSTGSPSTPTSSRPAPSPTGSAPPKPPPAPRTPANHRPAGAGIRADQWGQTT
jgi:DNA replication protein DnaC